MDYSNYSYPDFLRKYRRRYPVRSGREVYEMFSMTRLNTTPPNIIKGYVCAGAQYSGGTEPRYTADQICDWLVIDGSLVWYRGERLTDLVECSKTRVRQIIPNAIIEGSSRPRRITRTFKLVPPENERKPGEVYEADEPVGTWTMTDVTDSGDEVARVPGIPADMLIVIPNGLGMLQPNQWAFYRLEEIQGTITHLQSGAGVKTLVLGNVRSAAQTKAALNNDDDVTVVPGDDVRVDRGTSTAAVTQLQSEFDRLQALYYSAMTVIDTAYQPGRPVASDRYALMGPMLREVERLRGLVNQALQQLTGQTATFEQLYMTPVEDRTKEFDLLERAEARSILEPGEFKAKARRLI